jgi:uncharacterized membrane protein
VVSLGELSDAAIPVLYEAYQEFRMGDTDRQAYANTIRNVMLTGDPVLDAQDLSEVLALSGDTQDRRIKDLRDYNYQRAKANEIRRQLAEELGFDNLTF